MQNSQLPIHFTLSVAENDLSEIVRLVHAIIGQRRSVDLRDTFGIDRSEQPVLAEQASTRDKGLLIDCKQVAQLLRVSRSTVYGLRTQGKLPKPIKIGCAVRWKHDEIKQWVDAGCP